MNETRSAGGKPPTIISTRLRWLAGISGVLTLVNVLFGPFPLYLISSIPLILGALAAKRHPNDGRTLITMGLVFGSTLVVPWDVGLILSPGPPIDGVQILILFLVLMTVLSVFSCDALLVSLWLKERRMKRNVPDG